MRSPSSGLAATLSAAGSAPGFIVQIEMQVATLRICSFAAGFTFNGFTWTGADLTLQGINWQSGGLAGGSMTLGDVDLLYWAYAANLALQNAPVTVWAIDAGAPNEAEPLWYGRIGEVTKGPGTTSCSLVPVADLPQVPRRRAQAIVPSYLLVPAGTVINVGAQQWIIDRQFDVSRAASGVSRSQAFARARKPRVRTTTTIVKRHRR